MPLIEGPDPFGEETTEAVREVAAPLKAAGVDTVILGCTHYPIIRPIFQRVFGRDVTLVFSADETAREVAETLARKGIENDAEREGTYRFLTTGDPGGVRGDGQALPPAADPRGRARRRWRRPAGGMIRGPPEPTRRTARDRHDGRRPDQLRELDLQPDFLEQPHGSILYAQGTHRRPLHRHRRGGHPALAAREGARAG